MLNVRYTVREDLDTLREIVDDTGLFPADLLNDLVSKFLSEGQDSELWLTCQADGKPVGFCYAAQEQLTAGTWNMRAIAVTPSLQGRGYGRALVARLESTLRESGQRTLIVDTSSSDPFAPTRQFYLSNGYTEEARIRDFWSTGDDKIVFWKSLTSS